MEPIVVIIAVACGAYVLITLLCKPLEWFCGYMAAREKKREKKQMEEVLKRSPAAKEAATRILNDGKLLMDELGWKHLVIYYPA